jgi:dihydroorotase
LEYCKGFDIPVVSHPEDLNLSAGGAMHEGYISTQLGLPGIPAEAEEVMVARDILLAELTGGRLHLAHVSTAGSVRLVREAKSRGAAVTCETAPHYFTLTQEAVRDLEYHTSTKMNPPLRTQEDREAIIQGLRDGTIDAIASDHAPHSPVEKDVEFILAMNGIVGLETSLGLALKLVHEGWLSFSQLVERMSVAPARILGIPGGTLRPGSPAHVTVIDPAREWTVDVAQFKSKSRNSPFQGWKLRGRAVQVWVEGKKIV